jgi:CheY-like chemotaxis protein
MLAARTEKASEVGPVALIVFPDEAMRARVTRSLRGRGYRTFSVESLCGDADWLRGLHPSVIVLDVRRELLGATRTLVDLSARPSSPPVVLVSDDDGAWVAPRFGLISVPADAGDDELARAVELSRREGRRPAPPG